VVAVDHRYPERLRGAVVRTAGALPQLVDESAALTDELRTELPRDNDPVPPALLQPSWAAMDVAGHLCLARVAAFGAQSAYFTIWDGFWLCVLCPAGRRPQLKPVRSPTDVGWQLTADA
jgi:hypothetical protein